MTTLLLATRNKHKVQEIRAILGESFHCLSLDELGPVPDLIEDADTFAGNAIKKALQLARWLTETNYTNWDSIRPTWVLADDSGLEVDALNGLPGVHSARFAAPNIGAQENSSDGENTRKLLRLLVNVPAEKRTARFRCVLALAPVAKEAPKTFSSVCYTDETEFQTELFEGVCEGRIGFAPAGNTGFGYDPIFIPNGFKQSFAELPPETKNRLSHRSAALNRLRTRLQGHC